ncbi:MAG: DEAD/DEAH box helicase family protein, partial [Clostridia bacterium]|nr:DEAD/DEAH box helicase family protein [Clostridia bacterium]
DEYNRQQRERERLKEEQRLQKERAKQERERKKQEKWNAHVQEVLAHNLPARYKNPYTDDVRAFGVHAETAEDGLALSIANLCKVDIEYISQITGEDFDDIINELRVLIYQNPATWDECFYKGWETADEYLTGNLQVKLEEAEYENERFGGIFSENIEFLKRFMPKKIPAADIYITLGSPWVPADVIKQFVSDVFDKEVHVFREPYTGTWVLEYYTYWSERVLMHETYGTKNLDAMQILELSLNMKTPIVYDEVYYPERGYVKVVNKDETVQALDRQAQLIRRFREWVWSDAKRMARLEDIYHKKYGCIRKRNYDGRLLQFPGMSKDVSLYGYQKNAVARILYSRNTLLAHEVGAGKTYVMVAAGMEMRRTGLSDKNMYVVPNNIVVQWTDIFRQIYPTADVLSISPKDFTPAKREKTLLKIQEEDHDAIIIPYSCFERIPVSGTFQAAQIQAELDKIDKVPSGLWSSKLRRRRTALTKKQAKINAEEDDEYAVYFDNLGITRLFVDEAHNYKNLSVDTNIDGVLGINATGSAKCTDMLNKVRIVQLANGGGGVIMATGTPLTNSVTEAFVMQTYLQPDDLAYCDTDNFDSWAGMFGEKVTEFEIDVDTSGYRLATRFTRFHNLPELTSELAIIADFHSPETSDGIPVTDGYTDELIPKTKEFASYLKVISERADRVRQKLVDRHDDNMLVITTDGRKAALDLRLTVPDTPETPDCKVVKCADNVFKIYKKYAFMSGTQLVFCDTSTPKDAFNIYDELRRLLTGLGVPKDEIAFIHDAQTDDVRFRLFEKVRCGDVRVLIGSTFKMGLGMNVQDRLIAIHHIDIPWRPADMVQREGRILRPGNMNEKVFIFRYITEGSFDAYSWQILEAKQRFISEILSGSYAARSGDDIKDSVLNYAEVKALAIGNPLIKERVEKANELATYLTLKRKYEENRSDLMQRLTELPEQIASDKKRMEECEIDIKTYAEVMKEYDGLDEWKSKRRAKAEKNAEEKKAKKAQVEEVLSQMETAPDEDDEIPADFYKIDETNLTPEEKAENKKFIALDKKAIAEHGEMRDKIFAKITETDFHYKDETVGTYRGFEIVIPSGMDKTKPYVWLKGAGKYYVELGTKMKGYMVRIDNFLA